MTNASSDGAGATSTGRRRAPSGPSPTASASAGELVDRASGEPVAGSRTSGGIIDPGTGRRASRGTPRWPLRRPRSSGWRPGPPTPRRSASAKVALAGGLQQGHVARIATVGPVASRRELVVHRAVERVGLDDPRHEADRSASAASTNSPSQGELLRLANPDEARQQPGPTEVDREAPPHEDRAEPGLVDAITRSHPIARDIPAPAASPSTAAIVGFVSSMEREGGPMDAVHRRLGPGAGRPLRRASQVHPARERPGQARSTRARSVSVASTSPNSSAELVEQLIGEGVLAHP